MAKTKHDTKKKQKKEPKRLSRVDRLRLNLSHVTLVAFREGITRRRVQAENILHDAEDTAALMRYEADQQEIERKEYQEEHQKLIKEFEEKYGVNLDKVKYDLKTGIVVEEDK